MARIATIAILTGAALALMAWPAGAAPYWSIGPDPTPPYDPPPSPEDIALAIEEIMSEPTPDARLAAFLATIRHFDGRDDYSILYGGGHFSGWIYPYTAVSQGVPINLPGYAGKKSTAAGAYQINLATYREFAPVAGVIMPSFTPDDQDAIAIAILKKTGAYDAIIAGDIPYAFQLASSRWASLPGSTAGQHAQSESTVTAWFDQFMQSNA